MIFSIAIDFLENGDVACIPATWSPRLDDFNRLGSADDANTFVPPAKTVQMLVARDDQIRLCRYGACSDMVIVWIALDHARYIARRDHVCHASQFTDEGQWR